MAHDLDQPSGTPEVPAGLTRRSSREAAAAAKPSPKDARRIAKAQRALAKAEIAQAKTHPTTGSAKGAMRSVFTLAAVAGLVATVAIPAYGAWRPAEQATTIHQVAQDGAQSLVVASSVEDTALQRETYSATTPEEIETKKAEELAIARAKAAAEARAASYATVLPASVPLVAPGTGEVRRPLPYFDNFGTPYAGHRGVDYMVAAGTPIYSVAEGTVVESSENGPGWGVYVKIAHNIGGTSVTTLYAHMTYGTRAVSVGDHVAAGQMIGQVGATGRASGTHLHLEVVVSGSYVNGESWLVANGG